jgi:hypothetical protein
LESGKADETTFHRLKIYNLITYSIIAFLCEFC